MVVISVGVFVGKLLGVIVGLDVVVSVGVFVGNVVGVIVGFEDVIVGVNVG